MRNIFENITITGISGLIPNTYVPVDDLFRRDQDQAKRIIKSTGISGVRIAHSDCRLADLFEQTANDLIQALALNPSTIDGIICMTQTADFVAPALSTYLQHRLGITKDAVAFDINYGCSGYIYGLFQGSLLLNTNSCSRVLILSGDIISRYVDPSNHKMRVLLGDGVSATIVEKGNDSAHFVIKSDGSGYNHLFCEKKFPNINEDSSIESSSYYSMSGDKIMEFVLKEIPSLIDELLRVVN